MQQLVVELLRARKHLESFQKSRSKCIAGQAAIRARSARETNLNFLALDLAPFRLRADNLLLTVPDVYGDVSFTNRVKGVNAPVDMFFGQVMRFDERAGAPVDFQAEMRKLHRAGARFMKSIKAIEHSHLLKLMVNSWLRPFNFKKTEPIDDITLILL